MKNFFLGTLLLSVIASACHPKKNVANKPPNVILILADDQGWGDLRFTGNSQIATPNIDELGIEGASFNHFFVQPVCSPTRAEILTGRYHVRSGVYSTSAGGERIDLDEHLISEAFQAAGYRTAAIGKWHSGSQHPYHPNSRGFQEFYGFTSGHWGHYFNPPLEHNGHLVKGKGYLPDDLTGHALDFIEKSEDPFFVFMAYNTPHSPMQVPDEYWSKFEQMSIDGAPEDSLSQNHAKAALAMVENLDWNVGRITQHLKQHKLEENTIIIYMTDNGPNGERWNGNMKGRKGSTDEGGVRSPLFVQWKNHISKGLKIENISAAIDLAPTLMDFCNLPAVNIQYDGMSLAPLLLGQMDNRAERMLVQHWRGHTSVRNQDFKLDHRDVLYNMNLDAGQTTDIGHEHPKVYREMKNYKIEWLANLAPESSATDKRSFTVGHPNAAIDHLPARDGVAHGSIIRSNRYPNDSYFTGWANIGDSITWDIEVLDNGNYDFFVHYTCPEDQVGSTIELKVKDYAIQKTIDTPHHPPLVGSVHDRVKRIESYVKDFRELHVGKLELQKGRTTLVLKAVRIANEEVMDINRITIRRL